MVDDAHASGVLGRNGRGTVDHFDLHGRVDIQVGTLSKAVGVLGGYVAGRQHLRDYLIQRCAAVPLLDLAATGRRGGLPRRDRRPRERAGAHRAPVGQHPLLQGGPRGLGFDTGISETPITPVIVGDVPSTPAAQPRGCSSVGVFATGGRLPDRRPRARRASAPSSPASTRATSSRPASTPSPTRGPRAAAHLMPAPWRTAGSASTSARRSSTRRASGRTWADVLGIPRLTFMAALGAAIDARLGLPRRLRARRRARLATRTSTAVERRYGGFQRGRPLSRRPAGPRRAARARAIGWPIVANQPAVADRRAARAGLRRRGHGHERRAGRAQAAAGFFDAGPGAAGRARSRRTSPTSATASTTTSSRPPRPACGAVWLRRGPWGVIPHEAPPQAALVVDQPRRARRADRRVLGDGIERAARRTVAKLTAAHVVR